MRLKPSIKPGGPARKTLKISARILLSTAIRITVFDDWE